MERSYCYFYSFETYTPHGQLVSKSSGTLTRSAQIQSPGDYQSALEFLTKHQRKNGDLKRGQTIVLTSLNLLDPTPHNNQ